MHEEERDVCGRVEQEVSLGNTKALRAWRASSEMLWRLGSHLWRGDLERGGERGAVGEGGLAQEGPSMALCPVRM